MSVYELNGIANAIANGNGRRRPVRRRTRGTRRSSAVDAVILNDRRLARVRDAWAVDGRRVLDHLTQAAVRAVRTNFAAVSFVDRERQLFKSAVGLPEPWATSREVPLAYSFCQHAVATGRPFIVRDARVHPLVRNNPSVHELGVIAYAGMPLATSDGLVLGTFNVVAHEPREWTPEELDVVRDLAHAAMAEIEERLHAAAEAQRACEREGQLCRTRATHEAWVESAGHDLRQFLNVITMGTALMLETEGRSNGEVRRHGERIAGAAARMNRMIEDLLDACREGRGTPLLTRARLAPARLVEQAADECAPVAERRGIALVKAVDVDLPDVDVDADAIARVLSNLVSNAIKFTPPGGIITIRVERAACGGIAFAVEDTGPGIPEEQRAHVFERFWQASRRAGGLGLGLAIARMLVEAHDGRIGVEPAPGGGARFVFTLPAAGVNGRAPSAATA